jgi:hypothetical protein
MGIHRELAAGFLALSFLAIPQAPVQDGLECVVIYDEQANAYWRSDPTRCTARLSPAIESAYEDVGRVLRSMVR